MGPAAQGLMASSPQAGLEPASRPQREQTLRGGQWRRPKAGSEGVGKAEREAIPRLWSDLFLQLMGPQGFQAAARCDQNCPSSLLICKDMRTESRGRRQQKAKTGGCCVQNSVGTPLQLLSEDGKTNAHVSFSSFFMFRIESVVSLNLMLESPTKKSSKCHK